MSAPLRPRPIRDCFMEIWHKLRDRCKAIPSCLQLRTRVTHCNHYFGHVFNPFGLGLVGPCRTPAISLPHHHLEPPVSCKGLATAALVTQQAPLRPPAMHLNKSWLWLWLWPDKVQPGGATAKSPVTSAHMSAECSAVIHFRLAVFWRTHPSPQCSS